jgi:hypothetical protein
LQCGRLEKELEAEQAKYKSIKQELDKTIAELLE